MNHLMLVGTVQGSYKVIVESSKTKNKLLEFHLGVDSPYRSKDGETNKQILKVKVWSSAVEEPDVDLADQELVCVKGHVRSFSFTNKNGECVYYPELMAEKLTNLSFYA